jgi:hypothetical protein
MYGIAFEWDPRKDSANRRKHGVGFVEASTVFGDPLSITIPDPDHAKYEERFVIVGMSGQRSLLIEVHTIREDMKDATTKKPTSKRRSVEMRKEYDFSGGVRGKYVARYRSGTNIALLDPELAEAFPDSKSVNDALRALLAVATRADRRKRL